MAESVTVAAFLRGRAGKEEELARRLQALVLASRLWFLYERYESQEHLNRYRENAVLRSFLADAARLVDGKVDIRTFRMVASCPA